MPLAHPAGDAQADFGEALVVIGGEERKAHYLAMDLPQSDDCFVMAFPAETTEAFLEGHNQAFAYFGGVPRNILYDNTKLAVAQILGDGTRKKTQAFSELQSHYLFQERFGRPGKGNDKGKVEGLVGYARRNFLVPVPRVASWDELNAHLLEQCRKRRQQRLRGQAGDHRRTVREGPCGAAAAAGDAVRSLRQTNGRVSSLSLVRYRGNDYSVPVCWGHREVLVKGYVHEVVISCGAEVIARHPRSYEREDMIFDPLHYLALLEQKTNALDQAAPLVGWELPEEFAQLRRLLEARLSKRGKREYVQVLRLLETFSMAEVTQAIEDALRMRAISFDAVKHLLLCRIEQRPPRLDLENYPHLPVAQVATTAASDYLALLTSSAGRRLLMETPQVLLDHHLKTLRLPTFLREYDKVAQQCAAEGVDYPRYLLRLSEQELLDRERRATERRIKQARFRVVKSLDSFDFLAMPSLNKALVLELARCEFLQRRENVLALGNSGHGQDAHLALALGLAACQKGHRVRFTTAASLVHELMEASDEKRLLRFQKLMASYELLIIDELGFVPLSKTGAEMLFEVFSLRYERGATMVTSNLPFKEWTEVLGSERLTGALLDRLTHHVHILEMNGESYRLKQSKHKHSSQPGR